MGKNILEFELRRPSSGSVSTPVACKVNLYVFIWMKRGSRKARRSRRKSRTSKLVKIRVFLVDEQNRKSKRIAELRKRVSRSNWHRLGLPVSLIHSRTKAENETVKLRVRCKRCNRKVQLIMPGDDQKCRKKKRRRMAGSMEGSTARMDPSDYAMQYGMADSIVAPTTLTYTMCDVEV
nr:hypothetical protein BaRGS_019292 [Batillaria attramentaria]